MKISGAAGQFSGKLHAGEVAIFDLGRGNWIAENVGVHNYTVSAIREDLEAFCQIDKYCTLKTKDGRDYPARAGTAKEAN